MSVDLDFYTQKILPGLPFMISLGSVSNQRKGAVQGPHYLAMGPTKATIKVIKITYNQVLSRTCICSMGQNSSRARFRLIVQI